MIFIYSHSQGEEGSVKNRGRSLANVNDKIMFDRYDCINSTKHCKNDENIDALYFITS